MAVEEEGLGAAQEVVEDAPEVAEAVVVLEAEVPPEDGNALHCIPVCTRR